MTQSRQSNKQREAMQESTTEKRAAVDIGSHGIKYSIVTVVTEGGRTRIQEILRKEQRTVELGRGMGPDLVLREEAIERAVKVLKKFQEDFDEEGIQHPIVIATSAVRTAKNREDFVRRAQEAMNGTPVHVIDQAQEGRYGFLGAVASFEFVHDDRTQKAKNILVIDIGGGSIEVTLNENLLGNLEMGAMRFVDRYLSAELPLSAHQVHTAEQDLSNLMKPVVSQLPRAADLLSIGIGEFKDVMKLLGRPLNGDGLGILNGQELDSLYGHLIELTEEQIKEEYPMASAEPRQVLAAVFLARTLLKEIQISQITISPWGLRHGVIVKWDLCTTQLQSRRK